MHHDGKLHDGDGAGDNDDRSWWLMVWTDGDDCFPAPPGSCSGVASAAFERDAG